jgi:septal ring factor EnvC (AmiA/AmiB activator)
MWRHGSKLTGKRCLLALGLLLLLSPLSSWAEPTAKEKALLAALEQAEQALQSAQTALTSAQKALDVSEAASKDFQMQLERLKADFETLKGAYATLSKESEARGKLSDALKTSLAASQAETRSRDGWIVALGIGLLGVLAGGIWLW